MVQGVIQREYTNRYRRSSVCGTAYLESSVAAGGVPRRVAPGNITREGVDGDEVVQRARAVLLVHPLARRKREGRVVEHQADLRALESTRTRILICC